MAATATHAPESVKDDDWDLVQDESSIDTKNPPELPLQIPSQQDSTAQENTEETAWALARRNILILLGTHAMNSGKEHLETLTSLAPIATNLDASEGRLDTIATNVVSLAEAQNHGLYGDEQEKLLGELICSAFFLSFRDEGAISLLRAICLAKTLGWADKTEQGDLLEFISEAALYWLYQKLEQGIRYVKEDKGK